MVWSINFFFASIKRVHQQYRNFFESEEEDRKDDESDDEDTPSMAPSESAIRFYFELTYQLANEDLTKFDRLNEQNMYLCLHTASLLKDRAIKQQNEMKKLEAKNKPK
jgi:hypothetical protein